MKSSPKRMVVNVPPKSLRVDRIEKYVALCVYINLTKEAQVGDKVV